HGQSVEPQGGKGRTTHQSRWSRVAISAALQPRHESHRKSLLQAQGLPAQNRRANRHRPLERTRSLRRNLQTQRMLELLQGLRIRHGLIGSCSKLLKRPPRPYPCTKVTRMQYIGIVTSTAFYWLLLASEQESDSANPMG